jgi:hypothetical protein
LNAVEGHQPIITTCIFRSELVGELYYDEKADSIADIPVLVSLLAKYPFHLSKVIGGYFIKHAGASGSNFAKISNARAICPAFLRVEECIKSDPTIEVRIKTEILRSFSRRIDKMFFDLLLANVLVNDGEAVSFMQATIHDRRTRLSIWRVGGVLLSRLSAIVGVGNLSAVLSCVRSVKRRLRGARSKSAKHVLPHG